MGARTSQVDHCRSCRRIVALSNMIASSGERRSLEICIPMYLILSRIQCVLQGIRGTGRAGPNRMVVGSSAIDLQRDFDS